MPAGVSDDPVTAEQLNGLVAFIGDADGILKDPLVLKRLRQLGRVARFHFDAHVVGDRFGRRRVQFPVL